MLNYSWSDDYSVNDPVLDDHHKNLLSMFNRVSDLLKDGDMMTELLDVLKELKYYTIFHFNEEEKKMKAAAYEDLDAHVAEHKKFVQELEEMNKKVQENPGLVTEDLFIMLNQWLINHIQKVDMAYKDQL